MIRITIYLMSLILIFGKLHAQIPSVSVEINFNSRLFIDLIKYIEKKEEIKFYYLNEWIDSITVIQSTVPSSLEKILQETLTNTNLFYYFENQNNIILTSKYRIETALPGFLINPENPVVKKEEAISDSSSFMMKERMDSVTISGSKQKGIVTIGIPGSPTKGNNSAISGFVFERETGQPIIGATIYMTDLNQGTVTDQFGYYLLLVPKGNHLLRLSYLGRKEQVLSIIVFGNGTLNFDMEEKLIELKGVVVKGEKNYNVRGLNPGLEKVDFQTIKSNSSSMGEGDLMKTVLLLPGVKTVGESASGFNVRGGNTDQNLILMDGAPVFNPSHLFGFFSIFNPDVVREFKLYKSGIPTQYGGRLSSVLDVSIKNGNLKKISSSAGISPVSARICIDGPVIKDKASFLAGIRSSYSDWLLKRTKVASLANSSASFFDLNAKFDYKINDKNHFTTSGYISKDHFRLNSDTLYSYRNLNSSINLKHTFSKKLYSLTSGVYSRYSYSVMSRTRIPYSFELSYFINYLEGRTDFTWLMNAIHKLSFGMNIIKYRIEPGKLNPVGEGSLILPIRIPSEQALETGIYLSDEFNITNKLSINYGLRYTGFFTLGPAKVYKYLTDVPRTLQSRTDSLNYAKNKIANLEGGPEFRLMARYMTGATSSLKISYTNMFQYLQMISNTAAISPTDIWKITGPNLPAQKSWQISAGYYRYLMSDKLLSSIEVYYKSSGNILEYRGGTLILMNPDLEVDLLRAWGKAYGVELQLKKDYGALNGWISYAYSRSLLKADSRFIIDQINQGKYFPSNYDRPHDFSLVSTYRFSRIHSISSNITYSTGRPITYPVGKYRFRDRELIHYSNRNEYRIPDYFRWDISVNFEGKLNKRKLMQNFMSISVYNVTGRDNAYSVYFVSDEARNVKGYKLSVFSQPVLSVNWDFKF
jgi:hypothetical protein